MNDNNGKVGNGEENNGKAGNGTSKFDWVTERSSLLSSTGIQYPQSASGSGRKDSQRAAPQLFPVRVFP